MSHRILLVDDEPLLRRAFRALLEAADYEVSEAGSAAEAIERVREDRPALVFLDLGLPDRPGLDIVGEITAQGEVRVVALTGRSDPGLAARCRDAGCIAHLVKPVSPRDLVRGIPQWLADPATDAPAGSSEYSGRRTRTAQ